MSFNQIISTVMAIALFIGIAFLIYYLRSREENKGKELGKVILEQFVRFPLTIFLIADIGLSVAEGAMAASIGDHLVNPVVRYLVHSAMMFLSIVAAMNFAKEGKRFLAAFSREKYQTLPLRFMIFGIITLLTLGLPILNMYIIANGMGQVNELMLAMNWLSPFTSEREMIGYIIMAGKDVGYNPWGGMSYPMSATLGMTGVHLVLIFWKSLKLADLEDPRIRSAYFVDDEEPAKEEAPAKESEGKEEEKKGEEKKENQEGPHKQLTQNLHKFLAFLGFPEESINERLAQVRRMLESKSDAEQIVISQKMVAIAVKLRNFEGRGGKATPEERTALESAIREAFAASPNSGGLGCPLPKKVPKN